MTITRDCHQLLYLRMLEVIQQDLLVVVDNQGIYHTREKLQPHRPLLLEVLLHHSPISPHDQLRHSHLISSAKS